MTAEGSEREIQYRIDRIEEAVDALQQDILKMREVFTHRLATLDTILGASNGAYRLDRQLQELKVTVDRMSGTMATLRWVIPLLLSIISIIWNIVLAISKP